MARGQLPGARGPLRGAVPTAVCPKGEQEALGRRVSASCADSAACARPASPRQVLEERRRGDPRRRSNSRSSSRRHRLPLRSDAGHGPAARPPGDRHRDRSARTAPRAARGGEELSAARKEMEEAEARLGEIRLASDAVTSESRRLEHQIESMNLKLAAEEKRMYDGSIANAKELEALQHEIAALKERRSRAEDETPRTDAPARGPRHPGDRGRHGGPGGARRRGRARGRFGPASRRGSRPS